jgi:hypothetical protein
MIPEFSMALYQYLSVVLILCNLQCLPRSILNYLLMLHVHEFRVLHYELEG